MTEVTEDSRLSVVKRCAPILLVVAIAVGLAYGIGTLWPPSGENPDPNHAHADFAVWVNGQRLDFSDPQYMSGSSHQEEEEAHPHEHLHEYLHLHDGNGHVIHRHKPDLTLGNFFTSIGVEMIAGCLSLDAHQFAALDHGWIADFGRTQKLCTDAKFHWMFVVNGQKSPMDPNFVFADGDKILLTYTAGDAWQEEWKQMTSDACLYSNTCPWRGKPPAENCIADPEVPRRE